ncbi:MAG: DUF4837 family protein [Bacteroidales bacterium]
MKLNYISLFIVIVIGTLLSACKYKNSAIKELNGGLPASGGKTLEMLIVANEEIYRGELKDFIEKRFEIPQQGLNQDESLFDVVYIRNEGFIHSDMLQKHRNILVIDYKIGNPNKMYKEVNRRVFPQAVYKLMVDNRDSLFTILDRFYQNIKKQFYTNEHLKIYNTFKKDENIELTEQIERDFNFHITIPSDFYFAKKSTDFLWIRKETKDESFNIMIHKQPFTSKELFAKNKIIDIRNQIAKQNISGPTKDSYMGTEERFSIYTDTVNINGIVMVENRGLWRLFGDFMGGPFINYAFQNPITKDFVMIDCFLYSPKRSKRDLLMQLEGIVYSLNK